MRQYTSNLYLSNLFNFSIIPTAPLLIMCGNVARSSLYPRILQRLYKQFYHIIIIIGPYEYCGSTIEETDSFIKISCTAYNNITFLQRSSIIIGNEIFYGSTMWSYIPVGLGVFEHTYLNKISNFTIKHNNAIFQTNIEWIEDQIKEIDKNPNNLIKTMITFHSPSLRTYIEDHSGYSDIFLTIASHCDHLCSHIWQGFTNPEIPRNRIEN
jgi:hypothetical protein